MDRLKAISPVDGRYGERVTELIPYYSEFGLMRYRVLTEMEYFIALSQARLPQFGRLSGREGAAAEDRCTREFSVADAELHQGRRRLSPTMMSRPWSTS